MEHSSFPLEFQLSVLKSTVLCKGQKSTSEKMSVDSIQN